MIKPKAIDHICLIVSSLENTKTYYSSIFDFKFTKKPNVPSMLLVESPYVHFFITEFHDAPIEFLKKQHLSFEIDNLEQIISTLKKLGISDYKTGSFNNFQYSNYKWCEWHDPDGIRIECIEIIN